MNSALLGTTAIRVERADFAQPLHIPLLAVFGLGMAISYFFVYKSSFPSLEGGHASLIYFGEIAKLREQEFVKSFREQSGDALVDDMLSQVWRNSQILAQKFNAIKVAFVVTGLSLLPWCLFLAASSVTRAILSVR